ncbi:hypothetical protein IPL85_04580 [Candidatus Saccharibacteria bacterium]|nr:MAG: hypothetical protein IPL85_04580 [Candidatus Saccharibacteria bacterium]
MKIKNIIVYNIILAVVVFITAQVVTFQLTGSYILQNKPASAPKLASKKCTNNPIASRGSTNDPQLKALVEYENVCQSAFVDNLMVFTNMPISTEDANTMADAMAGRLKQFDKFSVKPIVIVEPDTEWGLVDFHEYANGFYDLWIKDYFVRLKKNGVTNEQMGIWIPFPEPQQEFWNNNKDPDDFANSVNRYFETLRTVFPAAQTGILLDSQTGETDQAPQLLAYTRLVKEGLVDYAGLQGFPWHPREESDTRSSVISAEVFAPAYLAEEVAKSLRINKIILNTGSYRHKKAENGGAITITTDERKQTLDSIFTEASRLKDDKYEVTVNIFAENKIETKEGVDWSYWQAGLYEQSDHKLLFTNLVYDLNQKGIKISIFDAR